MLNYVINNDSDYSITIFIHNLNFDGIIIISELTKNNINFKILSNKSNLYQIMINYCSKIIYLKCSYKIIPLSLRVLGELENHEKSYFPYKFVNEETINYIGNIPEKIY
jgi:hypothetical protein